MYEQLIYDQDGRVVTITLNRPDRMNTFSATLWREMSEAFQRFRDDDSAWVAIVTGAGDRAFSAGADVSDVTNRPPGAPPAFSEPMIQMGGLEVWKPIIAAVNGYALGGGCELALACDIIVATDDSRFGLPEVRLGLIAGGGGVHRLPRQLPLKVAMGYALTGKHMPAAEALHHGLVNEVVPRAELMDCARRWAAEILRAAPLSVRATKEAAMKGLDLPIWTAIEHQWPNQKKLAGSEDGKEGPRAFAERRDPAWQAR